MRLVVDGLIFQKDPYGGIARLYRETIPRMCDQEPDLRVVLFIDGPLSADLPVHPHLHVLRAPAVKRRLRVKGAWQTLAYPFRRLVSLTWNSARQIWLRGERSAIWHSTYYTHPDTWEGPQVVTVYDLIHERYSQFFNSQLDEVARQQKRRCIEKASAVICISQATRRLVENFYNISNSVVKVIPSAYSKEIFRVLTPGVENYPGVPSQLPYLLYVGSRVHYKNFSALLEAYHRWEHCDAVQLVVVGAPWSKEERQFLEAAGLVRRVRLLSQVDDAALCRLYNGALAFVFPSLEEGFGIPLLEAMACGCPVVASRIPSTVEVAADCPIYFEPDRPETLLSALDEVRQAGRASGRVEAGLERVKRYSWDETARLTLEVYRQVWSKAG